MWGPRNDGKESECTECADKLKAEAGSCTGMRAVLDVCTPKGEEGAQACPPVGVEYIRSLGDGGYAARAPGTQPEALQTRCSVSRSY